MIESYKVTRLEGYKVRNLQTFKPCNLLTPEAMELEIRPANLEDAAALHHIVQAAFAEYDGVLEVRPSALTETLEEVQQAIEEGGVLLAWDGDVAVGTVRYELNPDHLYVGRLAVLPSHRRRRVGIALMRYIEGLAATLDRTRIELCTRQSMQSNLAFYERLGYHIFKTEAHPRGPDVTVWFAKEMRAKPRT